MAHLDATDWLDIQDTNAMNDKRFAELGIVDAVKESTKAVDYVSPSAQQKLRETSSSRNVQIPVLKDQIVSVVTTPGFSFIPDNLPESDQFAFTAVDVFSGFRHYPAQFANNAMDAEWTKMEVMKNVAYQMGITVESLLTAQLEARKSQVWDYAAQYNYSSGGGTYTFNAGTDTLELNKAAQQETMFNSLQGMFENNELPGSVRFVANRGGFAVQKQEALKYGTANQKDIRMLGIPTPDRLHETGNISAGSDIFNGYAFRDGAIGVFENFPYDFAQGTEVNGRKWSISDVELPFSRMRANIYVNNDASDATALVGAGVDSNLTMTHFEEMAVWLRFYIVYRYNSDLATRANDILKLKGLTT